jgi:alpha-galactosidase
MYVVSRDGGSALPPLVTLDTEVSAGYVEPGGDAEVTQRLYNDGTEPIVMARFDLRTPEGWQVTAQDPTQVARIQPGRSARVRWTLHDDGGSPGAVTVDGSASWLWRSAPYTGRSATSFFLAEPIGPGDHFLSDLDWVDATSYWGPVEQDMSNGEQGTGDGGPITIAGTTYEKGLGVHAPSTITYFAGGDCTTVSAQVGIDDETVNRGDVVFEIWGDGHQLASSGVVAGGQPAVPLSADLAGVDVLELRVLDNGGPNYDHADWADARISCA